MRTIFSRSGSRSGSIVANSFSSASTMGLSIAMIFSSASLRGGGVGHQRALATGGLGGVAVAVVGERQRRRQHREDQGVDREDAAHRRRVIARVGSFGAIF
jgi:hypothetical protein